VTVDCFNPKIETLSNEALDEIRGFKLKKQISYVYERSPFYRKKMDEAGINPRNFKGLEDLKHFPFTTKDEIRQSQVEFPPLGDYQAAQKKDIIRIHSSSGTTGRPSFVGITSYDRDIWIEMAARAFYANGLRPDNVIIFALAIGFFVGGLPSSAAIEKIGATLVPVGTTSERIVSSAQELKADYLACTPSYAIYLAEYIKKNYNMDPSELSIRQIHCGAEPGAGIPSIRSKIEGLWNAKVCEAMGNADMAPIIFGECEEQEGMHFCGQEFIIPEIINPDTGKNLPIEDGVSGELIYTSVDRQSSPILRFRTRDHVVVWTKPCSCGRTSFRLRCIGRTDDMLIVLGVNVFPSAIKDVIASYAPQTTGEIQIQLYEPGPSVKPPLHIKVEYGNKDQDLNALKQNLQNALRDKLIFHSKVELVPSGTLPRYEMKAKLIKKNYEEETNL